MQYRYYLPSPAAPEERGRHGDDGYTAMVDASATCYLDPALMVDMTQYPVEDFPYDSMMEQEHLQYGGSASVENHSHDGNLGSMYTPSSIFYGDMTAVLPTETYLEYPTSHNYTDGGAVWAARYALDEVDRYVSCSSTNNIIAQSNRTARSESHVR